MRMCQRGPHASRGSTRPFSREFAILLAILAGCASPPAAEDAASKDTAATDTATQELAAADTPTAEISGSDAASTDGNGDTSSATDTEAAGDATGQTGLDTGGDTVGDTAIDASSAADTASPDVAAPNVDGGSLANLPTCITVADCPTAPPCHLATCTAQGHCVAVLLADQIPCNDGNACTTASACGSGQCAGTVALDCNDANSCTTDTCNPLAGCLNLAVASTTACDDGDPLHQRRQLRVWQLRKRHCYLSVQIQQRLRQI